MKPIVKSILFLAVALVLMCESMAGERLPHELKCGVTSYADKINKVIIDLGKEFAGKQLSWNLKYLNRTVMANEQKIPDNGVVSLVIPFPKLNPGVIASTELRGSVGKKGFRQQLFFYPPNPFEIGREQLKELKIGVWCPNENLDLPDLLKKLSVPFKQVTNINQFSGKLLLLSGVDFDKFPELGVILRKHCKKGTRVIILPPIKGKFSLDSSIDRCILFGKNCFIKRINKKFDSRLWGTSQVTPLGIKPVAIGSKIGLEFIRRPSGFGYCEIKLGNGSLIITSWNLVFKANISPTPLYLLDVLIRGNTFLSNPRPTMGMKIMGDKHRNQNRKNRS